MSKRKAREYGLHYDADAADRAVAFFARYLRHGKGKWAGSPFRLLPWQEKEIIRPLFGWKRADGTRRFRRGGIWVPKKNGKTPLGAGILLYMLTADGEWGAQCYSAATSREQAGLIYNDAADMVKRSPDLNKRLAVVDSRKTIAYLRTGSKMQALAAEARTVEGINTSCMIYDELHAAPNRKLWDALIYGTAAREEPFAGSASTAGEYDPESIGWEQWEYARRVLSGENEDPYFLPCIYAADAEDDWTDPAIWAKANPSMGVTIDPVVFAEEVEEAKNSPAKQISFKRYRLNIWTQSVAAWLNMEHWARCGRKLGRIEDKELEGLTCWGGLDLSKTTDLTAFALVFEHADGTRTARVWYWIPEAKLWERAQEGAQAWPIWKEEGWLRATEGQVIDYAQVTREVAELAARYRPEEIGFDPWNASEAVQNLMHEHGLAMVEVPQTMAHLAGPTKEVERLATGGKLRHGGNPVLRWQAGNVVVHTDVNENYKPDRKRSKGSIDGVMAILDAVNRAMERERDGVVEFTGF